MNYSTNAHASNAAHIERMMIVDRWEAIANTFLGFSFLCILVGVGLFVLAVANISQGEESGYVLLYGALTCLVGLGSALTAGWATPSW